MPRLVCLVYLPVCFWCICLFVIGVFACLFLVYLADCFWCISLFVFGVLACLFLAHFSVCFWCICLFVSFAYNIPVRMSPASPPPSARTLRVLGSKKPCHVIVSYLLKPTHPPYQKQTSLKNRRTLPVLGSMRPSSQPHTHCPFLQANSPQQKQENLKTLPVVG